MIIFKKSGIFRDNGINPKHEDHVYEQIESIIPYLAEIIEFDENLTLRDFFMLLEPDEKMIELVFGCHLGHFPIRPYMDEVEEDCVPDGKEEMDYIECSWVAEQFDYNLFYQKHKDDKEDEDSVSSQLGLKLHKPIEGDENENEISIYIDVHGWGPYIPSEDEHYDDGHPAPSHISYAIEFTPLQRMAHLKIKLDKELKLLDRNELGIDDKPVAEGVMSFTVFDLVGAILSEISFCGSPEERDEKWQDIVDDVDDAKGRLEEEKENEEDDDDAE